MLFSKGARQMKWLNWLWFRIKLLIVSFMNAIDLPTVNNEGEFIDLDRVQCVYIFTKHSKKFIHCFVDGVLYFLIWTKELERWFIASGFSMPEFEHIPEGGIIADVGNVPDKYKKEPKPKF